MTRNCSRRCQPTSPPAFAAHCHPAAFYDKCVQHLAVSSLAPDLAFDGRQLASLNQLPADDGRGWVVRPAVSPCSRGSAVLVWGEGISASEAAALLRESPGPFQIHVHEQGYPVFINGVFDAGRFEVSDVWRCHTQDLDGRRHLTAVTSLSLAALPVELVPRLATLASQLGLVHGPLHAEVLITPAGPRLIKLSPRLASTPCQSCAVWVAGPARRRCGNNGRGIGRQPSRRQRRWRITRF